LTFFDRKLHHLVFVESPITIHLNGGEMNKNIIPTILIDKAITLDSIEPFNNSNYAIRIFLHAYSTTS
jgi:hypothetical protein